MTSSTLQAPPLCRKCVSGPFDYVVHVIRPGKRTGFYERQRQEDSKAAGEEAESMHSSTRIERGDDDDHDFNGPAPREGNLTDEEEKSQTNEQPMDELLPGDDDLRQASALDEDEARAASRSAAEEAAQILAESDASGLSFLGD